MISSKNIDVINVCGENSGGHCGYCGNSSDDKSSYGITCEKMKPETYLNLMNRGWRRCGSYFYKPFNDTTCCPLYPIRCNASDFKLSKSQKKVLKRMKSFLVNGNKHEKQKVNASGDGINISRVDGKSEELSKLHESTAEKKDKSKKAKTIRYNLKISKLKKIAETQKASFETLLTAYNMRRQQRLATNKERELHEYLDYSQLKTTKHCLTVRTVRCFPSSKQFTDTISQEHKVYEKYQCAVHHDKPQDVTISQFTRFLISGGLSSTQSSDIIDVSRPCRLSQGQYHQQYWLDNDTLIAVGVVDLLPTGVSSVYLFYDPAYSFLDLGVYSALTELNFVNKLRTKTNEDEFLYYYMGFYVHNCVKMRYKANFAPSYLACPLTFDWVPVSLCQQILDNAKFDRFSNPTYTDKFSLATKTTNQIFELISVVLKGKPYKMSKIKNNITPFFLVELDRLAKLMGSQALQSIQISL